MSPGAVQIIDPPERRAQHDMVADVPIRGCGGAAQQFARFVGCAKLSAHHGKPAKGAKMFRLIGQQATIRLLGRMQDMVS
jgi:hypothetical protein